MTHQLKILAYRSLLGMYAATIIEEYQTEELKKEWWYKNAYRIYKKCKGMKKAKLKTKETASATVALFNVRTTFYVLFATRNK